MEMLRSVLAEPAVADRPPRRRWDYVLVALLVALGVAGGLFEEPLIWRPLAVPLAAAIPLTLLWRRTHPLQMILLGFSVQGLVDIAAATHAADGTTLVTSTGLTGAILTYAVARWGSGREIALALVVVLVTNALTDQAAGDVGLVETAVGSFIWLFFAALGVVFRSRASGRERRLGEARLNERQLLARELHDSVAHHVSAIAVQAQAGRAVAAARPDAAVEALAHIEDAARQTLDEMRRVVGVLREQDGTVARAPQGGLSQIPGLADGHPRGPRVDIELSGDLDGLGPSVEAGLYRLAQESITNARRHARHATRVAVSVVGTGTDVRLSVRDDGDPPSAAADTGFGLVGMAERATLLGGSLDAGPGPDRGWLVEAVLPKAETMR